MHGPWLALSLALSLHVTATAAAADAAKPWINLAAPHPGSVIRALVDFVELRGAAGLESQLRGAHDIVLAIDTSPSAFFSTGVDVDGDGVTGEMLASHFRDFDHTPVAQWTSDPDDVVFQAEIRAARALLERLDPNAVRLGVMSVSGAPELHAPVGSLEAARSALDTLQTSHMRSNTDLAEAIHVAVGALVCAPLRRGPAPRRSLILLSDGADTMNERGAVGGSIDAATARALAARVHILAIGFGTDERQDWKLLEDLARRTNGRFLPLGAPGDLGDRLPLISLVGLEAVTIENLSSGEAGRAIRLFPDGSFDGYVRLAPGPNRLRVSARLHDGQEIAEERVVHYERPAKPDDADRTAARTLLRSLQLRTLETQRMSAGRRPARHSRQLEIEPAVD